MQLNGRLQTADLLTLELERESEIVLGLGLRPG